MLLLHAMNAHQIIVDDWKQVQQERFQFYRKRPEEGSFFIIGFINQIMLSDWISPSRKVKG